MPSVGGQRDELHIINVFFVLGEILLDVGTHLLKSVWGLEGHLAKGISKAIDIYLASGSRSCWHIGC